LAADTLGRLLETNFTAAVMPPPLQQQGLLNQQLTQARL
jgi:hypothetical protein